MIGRAPKKIPVAFCRSHLLVAVRQFLRLEDQALVEVVLFLQGRQSLMEAVELGLDVFLAAGDLLLPAAELLFCVEALFHQVEGVIKLGVQHLLDLRSDSDGFT